MSRRLQDLDREARHAAQTRFDQPLVLEAGAGTGKTSTLVSRILAWTLGPGWDRATDERDASEESGDARQARAASVLGGVVAITFTEAAAAEMAARVARGLAAVAAGRDDRVPGLDLELAVRADSDERRRRATALLGQLDRLEVATIHAFCHRRLVAHPLELGLHPRFRIDPEGYEIDEVVREVVEPAARAAYTADREAPLTSIGARGAGPRAVSTALRELIMEGVPAGALAADPFAPARVAATIADLGERVGNLRTLVGERLRTVKQGRLAIAVDEALSRSAEVLAELDRRQPDSACLLCRSLEAIWEKNLIDRLAHWSRGKFTKSEGAALAEIEDRLAPLCDSLRHRLEHLTALDPAATTLFRQALAPLLAECETALAAVGLTTFNAILHATLALFERHPKVLARERRSIHQLLVDEFQDTDVVQCRIIGLLALDGPEQDRPGLFIVGDPKQSIYGWRSADLAAYDEFVARTEAAGGRTYQLVTNFRSAPVLLRAANRAIAPLMRAKRGMQPDFAELVASELTAAEKGFRRDGFAPVEAWVPWSANLLAAGTVEVAESEATEIEAEAVARDIQRLHLEHRVDWKDCAVLLRSSTRLDVFLEAFRRRSVPFVVTRDRQYFRRREIIEAAALVRTVVNPTDQIAFLTHVRSAVVGVPDAALLPLWQHALPQLAIELGEGREDDWSRIETAVADAAAATPTGIAGLDRLADWPQSLLAALARLSRLRRLFRLEPADLFIERLRRETLLEASEAARFLGPYRLANLERFFRRLESAFDERRGDVQSILRALQRSVTEAQEAEEALPKEAADNAVQVMTIHKAKGLEFPHVYLVQLAAENRASETKPTDADRHRGTGGPEEYSLLGAATLDFDRVAERRRLVAAEELVRILYVAMTRARERMVLCGLWPAEPRAAAPGAGLSLLKLLLQTPELPDDLHVIATRAVSGPGWVDEGGIRWKFPDLVAPPSPPARRQTEVDLPSAQAVAAAARTVAEKRAAASRRAARPLFGRASAGMAEEDSDWPGRAPALAASTVSAAQLAGRAIHRALERWDLTADAEREARRQGEETELWLRSVAPTGLVDEALGRTGELLARLLGGSLLRSLAERPDRIVARELPIVLPSANDSEGPLIGTSGIVDLVLRVDGELLVVDYKTDAVEDDATLAERAARYAPQLGVYAEALRQAFDLPFTPRAELWFVWSDRVWSRSHAENGDALA